jgi:Fibronectin type III domain
MCRVSLILCCCLVLMLWSVGLVSAQTVCTAMTGSTVSLAWTAPAPSPGVTYTSYLIDRQMDTGPWIQVQNLPVSVTGIVDPSPGAPGLLPGHKYTWRIRDTATMSDGTAATSVYAVAQPCVMVGLGTPANFTATPQ